LKCELDTICFEPSSEACAILKNKFRNQVKVHNVAITREKGTFELFETGSVFASLKRSEYRNQATKSEIVNGITLQDAVASLERDFWKRTLLKVDVQGGELEVLQSGEEFLQHCPLVITEAPLRNFYHNAYKLEELVSYMSQMNFVIGAIHTPRFMGGNPIDCDVIFVRL
jgi:FkbM family methyltransferase